jgi:Spy/CpxP family protein refolding chaperone
MRLRRWVLALTLLVPATLAAQEREGGRGDGPKDRQAMERLFRARLAQIVKQQLNLSDDQMRRLEQTNQRYETQRRDLVRRERELRMELRREVNAGDQANQDRVRQLLDETMKLSRDRLESIEAEQRELAQFLTPLQRAKFLGIQENVRRRVESARDRDRPRFGPPDSSGRERRRPPDVRPPA